MNVKGSVWEMQGLECCRWAWGGETRENEKGDADTRDPREEGEGKCAGRCGGVCGRSWALSLCNCICGAVRVCGHLGPAGPPQSVGVHSKAWCIHLELQVNCGALMQGNCGHKKTHIPAWTLCSTLGPSWKVDRVGPWPPRTPYLRILG